MTPSTACLLKIGHKILVEYATSLKGCWKTPYLHPSFCRAAMSSPGLPASAPSIAGHEAGRHRASRSNRKNQALPLGHLCIADWKGTYRPKHSCVHNFKIQTQLSPSRKAASAAYRRGNSDTGWDGDPQPHQPWAGYRDAIEVIRETKEEKGKEADRSKHRWMR